MWAISTRKENMSLKAQYYDTEINLHTKVPKKDPTSKPWSNLMLLWAHLPVFVNLVWPWSMRPMTLTCMTFDLENCDLWPLGHVSNTPYKSSENMFMTLTLNQVTFDLDPWDLWQGSHHIPRIKNYATSHKTHFLIAWPSTLTYDLDLSGLLRYHPDTMTDTSPYRIS